MKKYIFTNIIGTFVFNEHYRVIDKVLFKNIEDYSNKEKSEKQLSKKHSPENPEGKALSNITEHFKDKNYFNDFYRQNLALTKKLVKESVNDDNLIIQAIASIDEINKASSILAKRLREWYSLYNPEFSHSVESHEVFAKSILNKSKPELLKELRIADQMGAELKKEDLQSIMELAKELQNIYNLREKEESYLDNLMERACPNITAIAGSRIAAKLLHQAGSLKALMEFPSSTLQLLGAEKALFRHIKTGAKSPKFGFLHDHPLVNKAPFKDKGKAARALADKLSIAAKVDYFKGKFIGDELRKKLEAKFR